MIRSVTGTAPVVLSLTTHGRRLETVWRTLESIAFGDLRPIRALLFLDEGTRRDRLPPSLTQLESRGLEILFVRDLGPHTKYFHAVPIALAMNMPLVTIDDDVIYPGRWLARLHRAHEDYRNVINCYRARDVRIDQSGRLARYVEWPLTSHSEPRYSVFATGVSGVIYPVAYLKALQQAGTGFIDTCPNGDDIWLNVTAARNGFRARQITELPQEFPPIAGTQALSLWNQNRIGGNDQQLSASYDELALARVRADIAR